jgi:hypothetical protein
MKMIKFPSIDQFKAVVKTVSERAQWVGRDENGDPVFNRNAMLPKLNFKGTVKLHGTNASICYNHIDGLWCQSRERIITPTDDNAGFAFWVESNKEAIMALIREYALNNELTLTDNTICIYGEWCGGSIQKGVALNQLEKMFVVFGVKLANEDDSANFWMDSNSIKNEDIRCFNIGQFPSFEIEIDFNNPALVQNKLIEMTLAVEEECPVGKYFGVSGIGEGIVFTHMFDDGSVVRFKSKGTRHAESVSIRGLKVDRETENSIIKFLNRETSRTFTYSFSTCP